nr:uncharacterized protein LOC109179531 [Ipomoea batatas]
MVGLKRCIVALLSVVYVTLTTHIVDAANNFCATALNKPVCENMVKGSANWDEAITKAITAAMTEVAKASKSGHPECKQAYKDTESDMKESMEAVSSGSKRSLNIKLSAALTSLEDCTNVLKELKQDVAAATTLNDGVDQAIRACLAVDKSKTP